jgi:uncharacterized protein (DUF1697 family)
MGSTSKPTRYGAFLRGINVGGHRKIKMTDLARYVEEMGYGEVKTLIASGNVLFTTEKQDETTLEGAIERALAQRLGYEVDVMVRSVERLQALVKAKPFPPIGADQHGYVSILKTAPLSSPELPYDAPDEGFRVLTVDDREIFYITWKLANGPHGDPTKFMKVFGKIPTTVRNWNTIVKMAGG